MNEVAIIGQGPGCDDQPDGVARWGFPWSKDYSLDLYFEPHVPDLWGYYDDDPKEVFMDCGSPVFLLSADPDVPNSLTYPLADVLELTRGYLESSVAYAMGYAILKRVDKISLCGISGKDGYDSQRANIEYLIGLARGMGISVEVQDGSALMKSNWPYGRYGHDGEMA